MAKGFVGVGRGAKVKFVDTGWTCGLIGLAISGPSYAMFEVTDMETQEPGENEFGGKEFISDPLGDPGTLGLDLHFDPDDPPKREPNGVPMALELTFRKRPGLANPTKWTLQGLVESWGPDVPMEGKMTCKLNLKLSGLPQIAKAS